MSPDATLKAYALMLLIGAIGLLGILMILGLWWARVRHQRRMREADALRRQPDLPDPWEEAARRIQPEDAPIPPDGIWPKDRVEDVPGAEDRA